MSCIFECLDGCLTKAKESPACCIPICIVSIIAIVCGIGLIVLLGFIFGAIMTLPWDHNGILYNSVSGQISQNAYPPAVHFFMGIGYKFVTVPRTMISVNYHGNDALAARTLDGLSVKLEVSFQYSIARSDVVSVHLNFSHDFKDVFSKMARDVLRDLAADYRATQLFTDRDVIGEVMFTRTRTRLAQVGATVHYVQLRKISVSSGYEAIVEDKEMTKLEILKSELLRDKLLIEAETGVRVAKEEYAAKMKVAQATADSTTVLALAGANATIAKTRADAEGLGGLAGDLGLDNVQLLNYLWLRTVEGLGADMVVGIGEGNGPIVVDLAKL